MPDLASMGLLVAPLAALASAVTGSGVSDARWGLRYGVPADRQIGSRGFLRGAPTVVESHENQMNGRHRPSSPTEPPASRHARLHLSVPPFRTASGWAYPYLMMRNDGPATAMDVSLSFHHLDQPIVDTSPRAHSAPAAERTVPIFVDGEPRLATLGPGEVVSFGISPPWAEPLRWSVELRWTDDAGSHVDGRQVGKDAPD